MNSDRIIGFTLLALLVGWFLWNSHQQPVQPPVAPAEQPIATVATDKIPAPPTTSTVETSKPTEAEVTYQLESDELILTLSSYGATIRHATLKDYRQTTNPTSAPVAFDFSKNPALALRGIPGLAPNASYHLVSKSTNALTFVNQTSSGLAIYRTLTLLPGYRVEINEAISNKTTNVFALPERTITLGAMALGDSKNDQLGVDTLVGTKGKGDCVRTPAEAAYTGKKSSFGCSSGSIPAANLALTAETDLPGAQQWIAIKNRFFTQLYVASEPTLSSKLHATRRTDSASLKIDSAWCEARFKEQAIAPQETLQHTGTLYIGPKKLSLLNSLNCQADELMDFGWFWWMCIILLPVLNFFYSLIPNYGVAIILLTFLVRIVFWPLTHKSTESMKRMSALQPKLKALQEQFKDDPRKLQMETMQLYREHKVNPLSSCLPMLVQIPVFIALFTVLRSAVELRFAPFLWIADLSEPENLFAAYLPIGLNIWPLLMCGTMFLQSYLSPRMGDPAQQRMMMVMMPLMMLFMFYTMPSALCLYWTISQVLSIIQLLHRRWQERHQPQPA